MGNLNEIPAVHSPTRLPWLLALTVPGIAAICMSAAVVSYPAGFDLAGMLISQTVSTANASESEKPQSPTNAHKQQVATATTATHGMFVKDPYGCVYVFQYVAAQLTLTPMMDEHNQHICNR